MKAPIIVKWRYWKNDECKSARASNYLNYIGTREGVDKPDDSWMTKNATGKQKEIIASLLRDVPSVKSMDEYAAYEKCGTRGLASELIGNALDDHPSLLDRKTYLDYIGTRPRVEKLGAHGLFSDDGKSLIMSEERERINNFDGRINTLIISLSRDDAEACGFNNAERCEFSCVLRRPNVLKVGIRLTVAMVRCFHNESYHPHIHVSLFPDRDIRHIFGQGLEN